MSLVNETFSIFLCQHNEGNIENTVAPMQETSSDVLAYKVYNRYIAIYLNTKVR